ncbi:hypothetical protein CANTEDRAFT_115221 [Yamadazyma tenuis ATCC 10573]|uniref:Iron-sulfur assembly protein 1 n=1 Tax=Candida tenuis (strain ATCC 10573 / BCRC 21748 / CBS 615 / JCM 9827 / NBRC 10315 / NRRL Y-1498 / VKM Y-70) TaxID=590646 RepID=G3B8N6_CANTC|nr:uncharacterized protein CANTEDRAFT_115221 [Yamadazyma tenuis ATCC 10573]EGV61776.1 hypothetical protein CANTEDRAFT_115221 [Yamadazyma tenuis ATCC 10573]
MATSSSTVPTARRLMRYSSSHEQAGSAPSGSTSVSSSNSPEKAGRRFIQTIPITGKPTNDFYASLNYNMSNIKSKNSVDTTSALQGSKWNPYKLNKDEQKETTPLRRSRASRFKTKAIKGSIPKDSMATSTAAPSPQVIPEPILNVPEPTRSPEPIKQEPVEATSATPIISEEKPKKKRRVLKPRKAIITLSENAVTHLKGLMEKPQGKYIRVGVQNRGCSGLTYNLEYVNEAGKFDELVEQNGVKVFIDSKALFSIVGSEMDWLEDKLSSRFIFKNPNSKGTCGCGESFMV